MQIVPLEAAHLFDLNAAILGWLLAAAQPEKQLPRHNNPVWLVRVPLHAFQTAQRCPYLPALHG